MADSLLQPSSIFAGIPTKDIPALVRKPNDKFIVIKVADYVPSVKKYLEKEKLNRHYKNYLDVLLDFVNGKATQAQVESVFKTSAHLVDLAEVTKYFGEVLGPVYVSKKENRYKEIVFPVRSNYELFDYFLFDGKEYDGYSAKAEGGSSNTLAPGLIDIRVQKLIKEHKVPQQQMLAATVIDLLATKPIYAGMAVSVGLLVSANMFPSTITPAAKMALKKTNLRQDSVSIEGSKMGKLSKTRLSNVNAYKEFMDTFVLPRLKIPETEKKQYASGKKDYTMTNVAYGLGLFLVQVNKENKFDLSPLIHTIFQDLNVVKMGINNMGVPHFTLKNIHEADDKYYFRSKHRWDVVKDKLGVQL